MSELWVESIYLISQAFYTIRMFYQANETKKEKRSITPYFYWILTLTGTIFLFGYGILTQSWAIPLTAIFSTPFILYNLKIETKRKEGKK